MGFEKARDSMPALQTGKLLPTDMVGGAGIVTQGNIFFVKPYSGSDANDGMSPYTAFKTLVKALAKATANQNDIVYLMSESNTGSATTDYQSVALDWNKDGVHLIGANNGSLIGSRSRIAQLASVKSLTNLLTVSANNCLIANIEVYQGVASSTALAPQALIVTGSRNRFVNCQISGIGDASLDVTGARSVYITGSENSFQHCYLGLDTIIRATAEVEVEILGTSGAPVARTIFEDCTINSWTSLSTFKGLKTTYIDRFVQLRNCIISAAQNAGASVAPTGAIINVTPNGTVNMLNGGVFGYANISTATDAKLLVLANWGLPTNSNKPGIAIGQQTT